MCSYLCMTSHFDIIPYIHLDYIVRIYVLQDKYMMIHGFDFLLKWFENFTLAMSIWKVFID